MKEMGLTVRCKVWMRLHHLYMLYPRRHFDVAGRPVPTPRYPVGLPRCESAEDLRFMEGTIFTWIVPSSAAQLSGWFKHRCK